MVLILTLLELLLVALCAAQMSGQLYKQVQIHEAQLTLKDTTYTSLLACSVKCSAAYPSCKVFVWLNGICRHGVNAFNGAESGNLIIAYMSFMDKAALDFLAQLDPVQENRRQSIFMDEQWVFKNKLYWRNRGDQRKQCVPAREECQGFGGRLAVLHDKEVFEYFLDNGLLLLDQTALYVGLQPVPEINETCVANLRDECNGKMTWADGQVFVYQKHFGCSRLSHPTKDAEFTLYVESNAQPVSCRYQHGDVELGVHLNSVGDKIARNFVCEFDL